MGEFYNAFLNNTLIPSVYLLAIVVLLDVFNWIEVPKTVYLLFMAHYVAYAIYSMKKEKERGGGGGA